MTHPQLDVAETLEPLIALLRRIDFANSKFEIFDLDKSQAIDTSADHVFNEYWLPVAVQSFFYSAERIENEKDGELIGQLKNSKFFYFRVDMVPSAPMYIAVSNDLSTVKKLFCDFEPLSSEVFHLESN